MARVPYLTEDDLPEEFRPLLAERPINLRRALVNLPGLAELYAGIAEWFRREGRLDPRVRELAILYVGYASASAYAFCQHVSIGTRHGLSRDDIQGVIDTVNGREVRLTELDSLVLETARQLTETVRLADATWAALLDALGREAAMELVMVIAHYNYVVRMLAGLRIDVEDHMAAPLAEHDPPESAGAWH